MKNLMKTGVLLSLFTASAMSCTTSTATKTQNTVTKNAFLDMPNDITIDLKPDTVKTKPQDPWAGYGY